MRFSMFKSCTIITLLIKFLGQIKKVAGYMERNVSARGHQFAKSGNLKIYDPVSIDDIKLKFSLDITYHKYS